jgi:hypothetical protein
MKKHLSTISLALVLVVSISGFAQNEKKIIPCVSDEVLQADLARSPEAKAQYEQTLTDLRKFYADNKLNQSKAAAVQYTIPTVFHILHTGGPENLGVATITNAVKWINDDFAKAHADASLTAAPFSSLYINSDIKIMLAKKDPNGNCTDGIVHHVDPKTTWSQTAAQNSSYHTYTWDPTKYLNIYIVASIVPNGTVTGGGIIVGYAVFPGSPGCPTGDSKDHIVYNCNFLNNGQARSLTHEIAHWLTIMHTWGNSNSPGVTCGDDGMNDTPPTKGNFTGCPSSLSGNTCIGSNGLDNIQNIMNYSDCPINFTTDQTNAMRAACIGTLQGRNSVTSASNIVATDVDGTVSCAPVCDWLSVQNNYTVCSGANLTMKDASFNGTIASYAWSATAGGNITSPTASQTAINFSIVGTCVVTETVTNGSGSSVKSRTVTVLDGSSPLNPTYNESFEAVGLPANWTIVNPNGGSITWDQTNLGGSDGGSSYYIDGPSNIANHIDYLYMPNINPMAMADNTLFTVDYAYARQDANNNDKFEIQVSTDCGGTWNSIVSLNAATMQNGSGGVTTNPYIPQPGQWKTIDIGNNPNWGLLTISPSVKMRFMFQEDIGGVGFGNRFFLDNLNFSTSVGSNELTRGILFRMAPNPTTGEAKLYFTLSDAATVKVEVQDIMGRNVLAPKNYNLQPGDQNISVNSGNALAKGMYFVNMEMNGTKMSRKLIIE